MRKIDPVFFVICVYLAGLIIMPFILLFRAIGIIRVHGQKNLPVHERRGLLLIANHPSLFEPLVLATLFAPWVFVNPFRYMPWSVADKGNFYDPWYFFWIRSLRVIPVRRNNQGERSDPAALKKMIEVLKGGGKIILFPEGTRTTTSRKRGRALQYEGGKWLGELRQGIELLVKHADPVLVPVWVVREHNGHTCLYAEIYIGKPFMIGQDHWLHATDIARQKILNATEEQT